MGKLTQGDQDSENVGEALLPRPSQPAPLLQTLLSSHTIWEGGDTLTSPRRPCLGLAASTAPLSWGGQPEESYLFYLFAQIHTSLWGCGDY